jgi:hypothetical protein
MADRLMKAMQLPLVLYGQIGFFDFKDKLDELSAFQDQAARSCKQRCGRIL